MVNGENDDTAEAWNDDTAEVWLNLRRWRASATKWICAAAAFVILGSIVSILALRSPGKSSTEAVSTTPLGERDYWVDRQRFILFRTSLARVTESYALVNPNSPQSRALEWLVYQDQTTAIPFGENKAATMSTGQIADVSEDEDFHWRLVQRYALMVLAFSTSGEAWRGIIIPWENHVDVHECHADFQGVECDPSSGKVTKMSLHNRRLVGRIPDEIGLLTELIYLDLSTNLLEGRIPHTVYKRLTNLGKESVGWNVDFLCRFSLSTAAASLLQSN